MILIVDDEIANVRLLEIILAEAGYTEVHATTDPLSVLSLVAGIRPDLILLDLSMPVLDGFGVMRQLQTRQREMPVPILVLTADDTKAIKHRALKEGAQDFVAKPFDETEVLLRIANLLRVQLNNAILESKVRDRTRDLEDARSRTLQRLARAAEYRDDLTGLHTRRVGRISARIAQALGHSAEFVDAIRQAAPLHDVGKVGVPDSILLKKGRLTPRQFEKMKCHTDIGAKILSGSSSPLIHLAETIAQHHHERWDGTGYAGLAGEVIPLAARVVSVADTFDALTHRRPYKEAWPIDQALSEVAAQSGRQFDARVVAAFLSIPVEEFCDSALAEDPPAGST